LSVFHVVPRRQRVSISPTWESKRQTCRWSAPGQRAPLIPLRDEEAAYAGQEQALRQGAARCRTEMAWLLAASFKITMIEEIEVVFIVIAIGATGHDLLAAASAGALAALLVVVLLGLVLHCPGR
jgi:Ca2+/H+ antiporter, TMEM165/GDT1 family